MGLTDEDVREILRIIDESELDELRIETPDFRLHVRRGGAPLPPVEAVEPGEAPPRAAPPRRARGRAPRPRGGPTAPPRPRRASPAPRPRRPPPPGRPPRPTAPPRSRRR